MNSPLCSTRGSKRFFELGTLHVDKSLLDFAPCLSLTVAGLPSISGRATGSRGGRSSVVERPGLILEFLYRIS